MGRRDKDQRRLRATAFAFVLAGVVLPKSSAADEANGPSTVAHAPDEERREFSTAREDDARASREAEIDPSVDGWISESFHAAADRALRELADRLVAGRPIDDLVVVDHGDHGDHGSDGSVPIVEAFRSSTLAWDFAGLQISRAAHRDDAPGVLLEGGALIGALDEFSASLRRGLEGSPPSIGFKQFRVSLSESGASASTEVFFHALQDDPGGRMLRRSDWSVAWRWNGAEAPRIESLTVRNPEETVLRSPHGGRRLFEDRTAEVFGGLACGSSVFRDDANATMSRSIAESGRALVGITLGDANGDGRDDVFVPRPEGLPNLLLVTREDGRVEERGRQAGVDHLDRTASALFVDLDNDGDQDLVVATATRLVMLENVAPDEPRFVGRAEFPQADSSSLCAADYDGDGWIDLYVCNYLASDGRADRAVVAPSEAIYDAQDGGANRLYRNMGGFEFADATDETGLSEGATRLSLAASWEDFDEDGDQDLYVANDFGPNALYRNDQGRFIEIAASLGASDPSTGMSVNWCDFDRDGRMDIFVGNMFSAAGNRVMFQPRFRQAIPETTDLGRVRELARGNALLLNRASGGFVDVAESAGVANTQWTWGSVAADFDNSGHPDLLAVNGFLTGPRLDDL